ncbi:MAG: dephospho-CoA kinase [Bacillota bacterium]
MSVKLGLTGGIATGKSTVASFFEKRGAHLIDTDIIAKNVMEENDTLKEIKAAFGHEVFKEDGTLHRPELARVVFASKSKRNTLNAIVHPKVKDKVRKRLNVLETNNDNLIVIEVPLLFEAGFDDLCDKTLVVFTSKEVQLQRLMERDDIDRRYALEKINAQMPLEEKKARADYLINNSESKDETLEQVDIIIKKVGE